MKTLIISDVHGDYKTLDLIIKKESFDKLIVLGDLFNYWFKLDKINDNKIIKTLQTNKDKLILIKGNCDKCINYEELGLYAHEIITITLNRHSVTLTHGDKYSKGFLPSFHGKIFISGHTHVPMLLKEYEIIYANPGSVGLPRGGSYKTYMVFEDNKIIIKTTNDIIIKEMEF